ncbi:glycosyltransferase family 2 protein [Rhodoferax sp. U11-2br]|uniref:glycosyltransferase family 2 protein n=1 Tax=Rhodoferax sp. U11-2br TaxID=2838878 RepID=UPI001BE55BEB|nr:glycosyltransferase family 2 protein [Rhodoferax sp. U11-2br]MBT3067053.1 glycosyltransferase family 2 protein [Rhodoferax sp. U11-2br]
MSKFSVILATRDRPVLFEAALLSVLDQDFDDFEIIIVDDGSASEYKELYESIYERAQRSLGKRIKLFRLLRRPRGHGQSYSLNFGVDQAIGTYVLFLDDDDTWTDRHHLTRFNQALVNHPNADLYFTNQNAYFRDEIKAGPIWLESLEKELINDSIKPDVDNFFIVPIENLMNTWGFCHLNCMAVRRELYLNIMGMDEGIRWECDRDIFLRLVDSASIIIFNPSFVSRHNIPDPSKSMNMSTALSMLEKRLYQIRVFDKAAIFSKKKCIRIYAKRHKGYALKKIAEDLADIKMWAEAAYYAKEAFGPNLTFKWFLFTTYCSIQSWRLRLIQTATYTS